ncbi:MAG: EI24 domain-containing protein [Nitrospinota bacterium]
MLIAALRAVFILRERECWRVLGRGLAATTAIFFLLGYIVWFVLARVTVFDIGWLDKSLDVLGGLAVVVLTWLLFPAVATLVITFFLEGIIVVIEARYYPELPAHRTPSLGESLVVAFRLTSITVFVNLLVFPLYFFPAIGLAASYLLNAYLLSREYFELVAIRRMDPKSTRRFRKRHRGRLLLAGLLIAFLFVVPVVNLLAPIIAAAFMVHVFVQLRGARESFA